MTTLIERLKNLSDNYEADDAIFSIGEVNEHPAITKRIASRKLYLFVKI